jgi:transposase
VHQTFWQVSGPSFDEDFDLEQEEQRPGAGGDAAAAGARGSRARADRRRGRTSARRLDGVDHRWRNRFVDAGSAAMEDGMPGKAGARGSLVERRQRAEIQELKLALAEASVQLRIWQKGSEYVDQVPSQISRP